MQTSSHFLTYYKIIGSMQGIGILFFTVLQEFFRIAIFQELFPALVSKFAGEGATEGI